MNRRPQKAVAPYRAPIHGAWQRLSLALAAQPYQLSVVVEIIESDAIIRRRVLRMAHSAAYRTHRPARSLVQAIALVGAETLRTSLPYLRLEENGGSRQASLEKARPIAAAPLGRVKRLVGSGDQLLSVG